MGMLTPGIYGKMKGVTLIHKKPYAKCNKIVAIGIQLKTIDIKIMYKDNGKRLIIITKSYSNNNEG